MSYPRKLIVPAVLALATFAMAPFATGLVGPNAGGHYSHALDAASVALGGDGEAQKQKPGGNAKTLMPIGLAAVPLAAVMT